MTTARRHVENLEMTASRNKDGWTKGEGCCDDEGSLGDRSKGQEGGIRRTYWLEDSLRAAACRHESERDNSMIQTCNRRESISDLIPNRNEEDTITRKHDNNWKTDIRHDHVKTAGLFYSISVRSFPAISARSMFAFLLGLCVLDSASCMLFQNSAPPSSQPSCQPGFTSRDLQQLSRGMSNVTHLWRELLPHVLVPRVPGTQGNRRVRQFIKQEMTSLGWQVEEDRFLSRTPHGLIPFGNLVATQNPAARRRVVLACHFDSKYMPHLRTPFLGAIDSAVPCSVMMDTARKLHDMLAQADTLGLNNDMTLQFIFFDGEEAFRQWSATDSLYGSRHLAHLWANTGDLADPTAQDNLQNIEVFVLLDLIGNYRTRFVNYYRNTSHLFTHLYNIEQCLRSSDLLTSHRRRPLIFDPRGHAMHVEDDHTPFIQRGVKVLHLISTPFPNVWHTAYDTARYLDARLIEDFSRILRVFTTMVLLGST